MESTQMSSEFSKALHGGGRSLRIPTELAVFDRTVQTVDDGAEFWGCSKFLFCISGKVAQIGMIDRIYLRTMARSTIQTEPVL